MSFIFKIAIIALILYFLYRYFKNVTKKILFTDFFISGVDLKGASISDLISGGVTNAKLGLGIKVKSKISFPIKLTDGNIKLFYKDTLVAETSKDFLNKKLIIPANGELLITDDIDVLLSKPTFELISLGVSGKKPEIDYKVRVKLFLIPISFKGKFNW